MSFTGLSQVSPQIGDEEEEEIRRFVAKIRDERIGGILFCGIPRLTTVIEELKSEQHRSFFHDLIDSLEQLRTLEDDIASIDTLTKLQKMIFLFVHKNMGVFVWTGNKTLSTCHVHKALMVKLLLYTCKIVQKKILKSTESS